MEPEIIFTAFKTFSLKDFLNILTIVLMDKNQTKEAKEEPKIKYLAMSADKADLNPPNKRVPSIIACGFAQVTRKQDATT
jgi:hypothetical protein